MEGTEGEVQKQGGEGEAQNCQSYFLLEIFPKMMKAKKWGIG